MKRQWLKNICWVEAVVYRWRGSVGIPVSLCDTSGAWTYSVD